MTATRNKPTTEGRALGKHLARLTTRTRVELVTRLGAEAVARLLPAACNSCAFREGTFPNGCRQTVLDALKCVMEGVPFYCHQYPPNESGGYTELCAGYLTARAGMVEKEPLPTPWPFSHEYEPDRLTETPTEGVSA